MEREDFKKIVYTTIKDVYGWRIEENTLEDRVTESAEVTTTPHGVDTKLYVDGCELRYWQCGGHSKLFGTFDTEEDAELEWLNRTYEYDYLNSDLCMDDYASDSDAMNSIAEAEGVSLKVARLLVENGEKNAMLEAQGIAESLMSNFYYQKENSKKVGSMTKAFKRAISKAGQNYYAGGYTYSVEKGRHLCVDSFYTKEFRKDLMEAKEKL